MYFALSSQSQINAQELQTLEKMRELFALLFAAKDPIIDPDRILDPLVKGFKESGDIKGIAINGVKYPQDQQVPRTLQNMVIDNIIDCEGCFGFTEQQLQELKQLQELSEEISKPHALKYSEKTIAWQDVQKIREAWLLYLAKELKNPKDDSLEKLGFLQKAKEWAKPVEATGIQKALVGIFRLNHSETDSVEDSTSHNLGGEGGD